MHRVEGQFMQYEEGLWPILRSVEACLKASHMTLRRQLLCISKISTNLFTSQLSLSKKVKKRASCGTNLTTLVTFSTLFPTFLYLFTFYKKLEKQAFGQF